MRLPIQIVCQWVLTMQNRRKNAEIQMFQIQGDAYFRTDLKCFAHKSLILRSDFKLVGRKFVRRFIALKFSLFEYKPFKTS